MKKLLLTLLLILTIGAVSVRAEETVLYTCLFGKNYNSKSLSSYENSWQTTNNDANGNPYIFNITNCNNNNNSWEYVRCVSSSKALVAGIATAFAAPQPITKVVVTVDAITTNNVNSIKLYTSEDNTNWTEAGTYNKATGGQTVTLAVPASNLYYKVAIDGKQAKNGSCQISKVEFYGDGAVLDNANLSFGETTSYKVALGSEFTAPELNNPNKLTVTYSSSKENVATVDAETGAVTIIGLGVTEITAKSEATDEINAGFASYTINVYDPNNLEAKIDFSELSVTYSATQLKQVWTATDGSGYAFNTTFSFDNGKTGTYATVASKQLRLYNSGNNIIDVEAPERYAINTINFSVATGSYGYPLINGEATIGSNGNYSYEFKTPATSFQLKPSTNQKQTRINTITFTLSKLPTSTPVFTENLPGVYTESAEISLGCDDTEATIYYTLDGSTPTTESEVYGGPIELTQSATVKAIAVLNGFPASEVLEGKYIINPAGTELEENQVLVDFTNPASLYKYEGNQVVPFTAETGASLSGVELAHPYSHVTVTPSAGSYNGHVKAHSGATLVFKAYNKNKITKIEINGENLHNLSFASHVIGDPEENTVNAAAETSNLTGDSAKQTYEPGNDAGASSVVLTANDAANIHNVKVTTKAGQSTGVDEIFTEDADAPARYFNLQGVEVNPENLPAGLYIIKQGSKTFKAIVK